MTGKRKLKAPASTADRLNVWLPRDGVVGRVGQKTIVGPNGKKMSMSAAAKLAGIPRRTVIGRVHSGIDPSLWFFKGDLHAVMTPAFRITVKRGTPMAAMQGVDKYITTDSVRNRRKETIHGDQSRLGKAREKAARAAAGQPERLFLGQRGPKGNGA